MSRTVTMKGNPLEVSGSEPQVGSPAPEFTAVRQDLSPYTPAADRGKILVINSVPSLDTPVCAIQTRRFNEEAAALGGNVTVKVISMDLPFAMKRFCATEGIERVEPLSDHREASFGAHYGMLIPGLRLLARGVTVIDGNGVVRYHQTVPEIASEPDYAAALGAIKSLI